MLSVISLFFFNFCEIALFVTIVLIDYVGFKNMICDRVFCVVLVVLVRHFLVNLFFYSFCFILFEGVRHYVEKNVKNNVKIVHIGFVV